MEITNLELQHELEIEKIKYNHQEEIKCLEQTHAKHILIKQVQCAFICLTLFSLFYSFSIM